MRRGIALGIGGGILLAIAGVAIAQEYPPFDPTVVSNLATTAGTSAGNGAVGVQVQSLAITTAADGTFSGNWPTPFATAPTARLAEIEVAGGNSAPYKCSFYMGAVTNVSFQGKCWQIVATTLPTTTTALLGLTISPLANAAGGLTVRITGRQ